jgi:hypothetical protein
MFVSKAGSKLSGAPFSLYLMGHDPGLARKTLDKHSPFHMVSVSGQV